ncbi:Dabb family protein [Chelativorans sp. J32]|uniref:Dabb family protein n=1 Tax=Chelativorans sp. J32 TaxID=935840 RepID=UPI0004877715|nr:Dabb family protein [Chelativorans sp. J32]
MKKYIAAAAILSFWATNMTYAAENMSARQILDKEISEVGVSTFTGADYKPGLIRHIVLFRYKDGTTAEQRQEIRDQFMALAKKATRNGKPYIVSIESGAQNSGEGVSGGFEEGFIVTFSSEGDRNYYVGTPVVTEPKFFDPQHQKFKEFVGPYLADSGVLVFDMRITDSTRLGATSRN